jgi:crotonobetaine/carnitine-CoA ligase
VNDSALILANLVRQWCDNDPDRDVLTFVAIGNNGEFLDQIRTYRQLWENGQKLAHWLQQQGMGKGDAFAIMMPNHPEFVELMVASSILGTVFVPIDPRTKGNKLQYMLDYAQCKGVFATDAALAEIAAVWPARSKTNGSANQRWISPLSQKHPEANRPCIRQILSASVPSPNLDVQSTDPDAPMQMLYTSGTTGDPKAILSSHRRFGDVAQLGELLGLKDGDRPYTGLSLTHANAQLVTLGNTLGMGLRGVISRQFTKSRLWDITRYYGCTFFNLLGGMTTAIYAEPVKDNDGDNPVRCVLSAGMPAAIWDKFCKRFGVDVYEFYGAAEGGMTLHPPGEGPIGSCGKAVPSLELQILDDNDQPCPTGEAGEICFRPANGSDPVVKYFNNPEASEKKTAGGWLRMGDIGHVDEEGWLFFHYRKGGGIRRNGDFINPAFVEKTLSEHPHIDDVFVYGVPAKNGAPGEKDVVAAIVPACPNSFDAKSVYSRCREELESNFVPSFLHLVEAIPKTASEKPQERFLLEAFEEGKDRILTATE